MKNTLKQVIMSFMLLFMMACFKEDDYNRVSAEDLIAFIPHDQNLVADGSTYATIGVGLNSKIMPSKRTVVLKTSLGYFLSGAGDSIVVKADQDPKVSANLVSTSAGTATITASISGYSLQDKLQVIFIPAYPDRITVKIDSFSIRNNYKSEILITAALKSKNGIPSQGQAVSFNAYLPSGQQAGIFLNGLNTSHTDVKGIATIRYSAGPVLELGKLSLVARTQKEDKTYLSDTTYVYLTN